MSDRVELIETEFAICFPWEKKSESLPVQNTK